MFDLDIISKPLGVYQAVEKKTEENCESVEKICSCESK